MKVISGGQTGADQGGLIAARSLNIETGGMAPRNFKTEDGPAPWLADYGLVASRLEDYKFRTKENVKSADGTVIFMPVESPGSRVTVGFCKMSKKPYLVIREFTRTTPVEVKDFIEKNDIHILNVAGNRESVAPGISGTVRDVLIQVFSQ